MILMQFAGAINCLFVAAISVQLRRIDRDDPTWSYTQLVAGGVGSMVIVVGAMMMTAAVFRPDRGDGLSYLLFDVAWLFLVMPVAPALVQNIAIGMGILSDKRALPLFPRWLGFFNIWVGLLFMPGIMLTFFKAGPFAWNGLLAFWLPATVFFLWYPVMVTMMLRQSNDLENNAR
jgi:hypothetical protein